MPTLLGRALPVPCLVLIAKIVASVFFCCEDRNVHSFPASWKPPLPFHLLSSHILEKGKIILFGSRSKDPDLYLLTKMAGSNCPLLFTKQRLALAWCRKPSRLSPIHQPFTCFPSPPCFFLARLFKCIFWLRSYVQRLRDLKAREADVVRREAELAESEAALRRRAQSLILDRHNQHPRRHQSQTTSSHISAVDDGAFIAYADDGFHGGADRSGILGKGGDDGLRQEVRGREQPRAGRRELLPGTSRLD